jgi:hypothetical protein
MSHHSLEWDSGTPSGGSGTERESADGGQDLRLRLEACAAREKREVQALEEILRDVEAFAAFTSARNLPGLAERLGRAYSRAMARLRAEERQAVRAAVGGSTLEAFVAEITDATSFERAVRTRRR